MWSLNLAACRYLRGTLPATPARLSRRSRAEPQCTWAPQSKPAPRCRCISHTSLSFSIPLDPCLPPLSLSVSLSFYPPPLPLSRCGRRAAVVQKASGPARAPGLGLGLDDVARQLLAREGGAGRPGRRPDLVDLLARAELAAAGVEGGHGLAAGGLPRRALRQQGRCQLSVRAFFWSVERGGGRFFAAHLCLGLADEHRQRVGERRRQQRVPVLQLQPTRPVIESRWVSKPLAFAGQLRPQRLNSQPL
eukprot:COSAG01_NODE_1235_length_11106_cov_3.058962_6_plen_248_part_00